MWIVYTLKMSSGDEYVVAQEHDPAEEGNVGQFMSEMVAGGPRALVLQQRHPGNQRVLLATRQMTSVGWMHSGAVGWPEEASWEIVDLPR